MMEKIVRDALVKDCLDQSVQIVLIRAAAGMGKTELLNQLATKLGVHLHSSSAIPPTWANINATSLWDVPAGTGAVRLKIPENPIGRIVLAVRPDCEVFGLERAAAYGRVKHIENDHLLFSVHELSTAMRRREAEARRRDTGGWPVFAGNGNTLSEKAIEDFLRSQLLEPMPCNALVAIGILLSGHQPVGASEQALSPLAVRDNEGLRIAVQGIAAPLQRAQRAVLIDRLRDPKTADEIYSAYVENGRTTDIITLLQSEGHFDRALEALTAANGLFYIYRHGAQAFDRVLAGFPEEFGRHHEVLVTSRAMRALKKGDVGRAHRVLSDHIGSAAFRPASVLNNAATYSLNMRFFRLLMVIYEDVQVDEEMLEQTFNVMGELPMDAHLQRGSLFNCILEFYMRQRRFAEAEDVAARARFHYQSAHVPILEFYINLDGAIMRLMFGDAFKAARYAADARQNLISASFDSPGDDRLLSLVEACIAYEGGRPEQLLRFLDAEFDEFAHGEIWPSIAEFALHYGSQALTTHFSLSAARGFLDRWRVYQVHNHQFQQMIEIRDAINLQNGNRWNEAEERLSSISSRINKDWVRKADRALTSLRDRDEIFMALSWLRHFAFEAPAMAGLVEKLDAMLGNLYLTGRQRVGVEIWLAYVCKRQKNLTRARATLQKTLEEASRRGSLAPLAEERFFITELVGNQRIAQFLDATAPVRQILRRLGEQGVSAPASNSNSGLSRRELRVLLLLCEGGSNKYIANVLGLSEATIKFHLGNTYRKLGCSKRREAIAAAHALGLVA